MESINDYLWNIYGNVIIKLARFHFQRSRTGRSHTVTVSINQQYRPLLEGFLSKISVFSSPLFSKMKFKLRKNTFTVLCGVLFLFVIVTHNGNQLGERFSKQDFSDERSSLLGAQL